MTTREQLIHLVLQWQEEINYFEGKANEHVRNRNHEDAYSLRDRCNTIRQCKREVEAIMTDAGSSPDRQIVTQTESGR